MLRRRGHLTGSLRNTTMKKKIFNRIEDKYTLIEEVDKKIRGIRSVSWGMEMVTCRSDINQIAKREELCWTDNDSEWTMCLRKI